MCIRRSVLIPMFALALAGTGSASGQYVQVAPGRYIQQAQPRYYSQPPSTLGRRRAANIRPSLPYNRSPYTDDWSTGRHLPYPKPWMLPTRDPAHRGG